MTPRLCQNDMDPLCSECGWPEDEHDGRCSIVAERLQERADMMRKAMKEEEALAGWAGEGLSTPVKAPASDSDPKGKG